MAFCFYILTNHLRLDTVCLYLFLLCFTVYIVFMPILLAL